MAGLIIELNDRSRSAPAIHHFHSFPVRVGRGYQNDLIVSDPFVSPEHLLIVEDETGFVVKDLDSDNGVYFNGARISGKSIHVTSGDKINLGEISVRILSPLHPVLATKKLGYWSQMRGKALVRMIASVSLLSTLGFVCLDEYFKTFTKVRFSMLVNEVIPVLILIVVWTGLWSLIGYLVRRQTLFHAQLLVASTFIVAITFFECVSKYIVFAMSSIAAWRIVEYLLIGILLFLLMFFNLKLATAMKATSRAIASVLIAGFVIFFIVIDHFADKPEFAATPDLMIILKPPYVKLVPSLTIDEFMEKSAETFVKSKEAGR